MKIANSKPEDLALQILDKLKHSNLSLPLPTLPVLRELFECLYYTSMCTEESDFIKVTVTLIDPDNPDPNPPRVIVAERWSCVKFENRLDFSVKTLSKLSKAADPSGTSLAVYYDVQGRLFIWGMIDQAIHYQNFLNYESDSGSEQPGLFQATISDIGTLDVLFDYELLATLKKNVMVTNYVDVFTIGPVSKLLKLNADSLKTDLRQFLSAYHPEEDYAEWEVFLDGLWIQMLSRLLLRIQNYQHGGAILITDDQTEIDIKYGITYDRLSNAIGRFARESINSFVAENRIDEHISSGKKAILKSWYLDEAGSLLSKQQITDEIKGAITFLASQTCVDGVLLFDHNMVSKGFGCVLKSKKMPRKIYVSPTATATAKTLIPADPDHFGTRHRSMIAFCWTHPGSLGLVISQDGEIRAFTRIEDNLIMWENIKTQQFIKSRQIRRKDRR